MTVLERATAPARRPGCGGGGCGPAVAGRGAGRARRCGRSTSTRRASVRRCCRRRCGWWQQGWAYRDDAVGQHRADAAGDGGRVRRVARRRRGRSRSPSTSRRGCGARSTPLLVASQTLPIIAIAPLMIIWFGFGLLPKVVVIALVTFFPIADRADRGLRGHRPARPRTCCAAWARRGWSSSATCGCPAAHAVVLHRAADRHHLRRHGCDLRRVRGGHGRAGDLHEVQKNSFRTDLVLAAVVVTAAVSVALFALTYLVQRVVAPWSRPAMRLRVDVRAEQGLPVRAARRVLDDVSFDVAPGEFVSVIGPSGCGKTTLFDVIAGLERPDARPGARRRRRRDRPRRRTSPTCRSRTCCSRGAPCWTTPRSGWRWPGVRRRQARARARPLFAPFGLAGFEDARPDAAVRRDAAAGRAAAHGGAGPVGAAARRAVRGAGLADALRDAGVARGGAGAVRVDGAAGDPRHPRGRVPVRPGGGADPAARHRCARRCTSTCRGRGPRGSR